VLESPFDFLNRHVKVSRETFERLSIYHDLLCKWQSKINLVSSDSLDDSWRRHFLDSAQLINQLPVLSATMADLGSGAGFPGMVIAILGGSDVHLIESDARKISFLQEVARQTGASVTLHHKRIEEVGLISDIILARGCSELNRLLNYASHFVSHGTKCLFHKGKNYFKELEDAQEQWSFDHAIIPSVSDTQGVILQISNLKRRET
jgi:16S rRNA (guanine527-N7)-methyltransferase